MKIRITKPNITLQPIVETIGLCDADGEIIIDPNQSSRDFLDTLLHEHLHYHFPSLREAQVEAIANEMTASAWKFGYRRIQK